MSSAFFNIFPESGTGNGPITVFANSENTGFRDKVSTLTISNGIGTKNVTLKQRYRPYVVEEIHANTFPATGGTRYFIVHTEYDIAFVNIPSWIKVKRNNVIYFDGTRITAGRADGQTFALVAEENPGTERSTNNTFKMVHYVNDRVADEVTYFNYTQEGQA